MIQCYSLVDITKFHVMGQNQSHVTNHEREEISISTENVKIYHLFVFIKTNLFVKVSVTSNDFYIFLLVFSNDD